MHSPEEVTSWSPEVQRLMGYGISSPNIGLVEFVSASQYLSGDYDPNEIHDLDPSQEKEAWNKSKPEVAAYTVGHYSV